MDLTCKVLQNLLISFSKTRIPGDKTVGTKDQGMARGGEHCVNIRGDLELYISSSWTEGLPVRHSWHFGQCNFSSNWCYLAPLMPSAQCQQGLCLMHLHVPPGVGAVPSQASTGLEYRLRVWA